jgi:hypothetical protein
MCFYPWCSTYVGLLWRVAWQAGGLGLLPIPSGLLCRSQAAGFLQDGLYLIASLTLSCPPFFRFPVPSSSLLGPSSLCSGLSLLLTWWPSADPRWVRRTLRTSPGMVYWMKAGGWFQVPRRPRPCLLVTWSRLFVFTSGVPPSPFILLSWLSSNIYRYSSIFWTQTGSSIWVPSSPYVRGI